MVFKSYLLDYLHMCRYLAYFKMFALFFVYCGAIIDIGTDIFAHLEMTKPMRNRLILHRLCL